jgi:hypothetical protein
MKIIFISIEPLDEKIYKDWYIQDLIANKFDVKYWVYKNYLKKNVYNSEIPNEYINNTKELVKNIKKNNFKNIFYVLLIPYNYKFINLFITLTRFNCKTIFISWGASPIFSNESLFIKILKYKLSISILNKLFLNIFFIFLNKINYIKNFDIIFSSGEIISSYFKSKGLNIIETHLPDYDNYINSKPFYIENGHEHAVFLDVNLPFHRDLDYNRFKKVNAEKYLNNLNIFFNNIEKNYNVKVLIALHPSANPENYKILNRPIIQKKTAELVKSAKFVISHHSRSISYAILGYKPLVFIHTQELKDLYPETIYKEIYNLSILLDTNNYNIDNKFENIEFMVNFEKYDIYKYNYIISKKNESFFAKDIFLNFFNFNQKS